MDIKCNNCKQIYFETTDTYDPDRLPNGGMIDLKPKFKRMGWGPAYPVGKGRSNILYSSLFCPQCGSPLVVKGRLTVVPEEEKPDDINIENTCPDCGKTCKTYAGLVNHQRHCKGDE